MLFWTLLALMTAAAVFAVLWPLSREPRLAGEAAGLAVYRDQLTEIELDRARGVLPASEAEAAKIEVSRRLLGAASDAPKADLQVSRRRLASVFAFIGVPVIGLTTYLYFGVPELPDAPLAERLSLPIEKQDIGMLIGRLEERLEQQPNNGQGWELIAPIYLRVGRTGDAVAAQERAIKLLGSTVSREVALGEYIRVVNGRITPEAKAAFERALALDKNATAALFYLGLEAVQSNDNAQARKLFAQLLDNSKLDDPWRIPAQRQLLLIEKKQ